MSLDVLSGLRRVVEICKSNGIPHAVIGAVARNAWAPPRATTDADVAVVLSAEEYTNLREVLKRNGCVVRHEVVGDEPTGRPDLVLLDVPGAVVNRVDILIAGTAFEREAIEQAVVADIGFECRVVRPEHLIVYKLIAGRPRDLDDVDAVLRTRRLAGEEPDVELIRRWCAEWDVEDRLDQALRLSAD